jgi:hypothetical protein
MPGVVKSGVLCGDTSQKRGAAMERRTLSWKKSLRLLEVTLDADSQREVDLQTAKWLGTLPLAVSPTLCVLSIFQLCALYIAVQLQ